MDFLSLFIVLLASIFLASFVNATLAAICFISAIVTGSITVAAWGLFDLSQRQLIGVAVLTWMLIFLLCCFAYVKEEAR